MTLKDVFRKYDQVKFVYRGHSYLGTVQKVSEEKIDVDAYEVDEYGQKISRYSGWNIYDTSFSDLSLEWFDDLTGCDNSAIGMQGVWRDMSYVSYEAHQNMKEAK